MPTSKHPATDGQWISPNSPAAASLRQHAHPKVTRGLRDLRGIQRKYQALRDQVAPEIAALQLSELVAEDQNQSLQRQLVRERASVGELQGAVIQLQQQNSTLQDQLAGSRASQADIGQQLDRSLAAESEGRQILQDAYTEMRSTLTEQRRLLARIAYLEEGRPAGSPILQPVPPEPTKSAEEVAAGADLEHAERRLLQAQQIGRMHISTAEPETLRDFVAEFSEFADSQGDASPSRSRSPSRVPSRRYMQSFQQDVGRALQNL